MYAIYHIFITAFKIFTLFVFIFAYMLCIYLTPSLYFSLVLASKLNNTTAIGKGDHTVEQYDNNYFDVGCGGEGAGGSHLWSDNRK